MAAEVGRGQAWGSSTRSSGSGCPLGRLTPASAPQPPATPRELTEGGGVRGSRERSLHTQAPGQPRFGELGTCCRTEGAGEVTERESSWLRAKLRQVPRAPSSRHCEVAALHGPCSPSCLAPPPPLRPRLGALRRVLGSSGQRRAGSDSRGRQAGSDSREPLEGAREPCLGTAPPRGAPSAPPGPSSGSEAQSLGTQDTAPLAPAGPVWVQGAGAVTVSGRRGPGSPRSVTALPLPQRPARPGLARAD